MAKEKDLGQVFTPIKIVKKILDECGYKSPNILDKKIMEPAFGEGAFLLEIYQRIINEGYKNGLNKKQIAEKIKNDVYGIEIDNECFDRCIEILSAFLKKQDIPVDSFPNLYCMNSLHWTRFNEFDFVVGNPPYIRIHNLDTESRNTIKAFEFSKGMADLYVVFYELGIKMLNENGVLGYISPNSFIKNSSQKNFRKYLIDKTLIKKITNYNSIKVFEKADTYTCILILQKNKKNKTFTYQSFDSAGKPYTTKYQMDSLVFKDGEPWLLSSESDKQFLEDLFKKSNRLGDICNIQFGFATNRDPFYICENIKKNKDSNTIIFNGHEIEPDLVRKVAKGSKYHGEEKSYIIFPYEKSQDGQLSLVKEEKLKQAYPKTYEYFLSDKEGLMSRDLEETAQGWYAYARSQGIINCQKTKLIVNHIIKDGQEKVEVYKLDKNTYVYSGIYITAKTAKDLKLVKQILETKDFARYACLVGKDMSSGYKSFNTKVIQNYRY